MPKVDFNNLKRPARVEDERTLVDPHNPGVEIVLKFRKLGRLEFGAAIGQAQDLLCAHMTGYGTPGQKGYQPPCFLPPVDGQPVIFGEGAARVASVVARAQIVPDEERYSATELLAFMACDAYCAGLEEIAELVVPDEEESPDPLAKKGSEEA